MTQATDFGVLYIATGEFYIKEAIRSCQSLRRTSSTHIPVTLITDDAPETPIFDDIIEIESASYDFGDSLMTPDMLPYDRTLFLDTDTVVCTEITTIFDLLDRFDLALAHNPGSRTSNEREGYGARNVPNSFPLYNTGVMLIKNNERVHDLLRSWKDIYTRTKADTLSGLNQPSFREALYYSDVQLATLPPEYNLRIRYEGFAAFATDEVKIVHGRHAIGIEKIARLVNSDRGMRVFTPKKWPLKVSDSSPSIRYLVHCLLAESSESHTFRGRLIHSIQKRGLRDTVRRILRDIKKTVR